jgi:hypothetical protein
MRISKCLKLRHLGLVAGAIFLPAQALCEAANTSCKFHELPRTTEAPPYVYASPDSAWVVSVDELNGLVVVKNQQASNECNISVEAVRRVYVGEQLLVLRSLEVASDDVFFFDATSCKQVGSTVHLGVSAASGATEKKLRRQGLCSVARQIRRGSSTGIR